VSRHWSHHWGIVMSELLAKLVIARLQSREDIINDLTDESRSRRASRGGGWYPFAWNIKLRGDAFRIDNREVLLKHNPDLKLNPAHDPHWEAWLAQNDPAYFGWFCEDALSQFLDGDWTSYPGDDHGDWHFTTTGRSGGWLILTKWRFAEFGRGNMNADGLLEWLEGLDEDDLRKFYNGIVCLDHELSDPDSYYVSAAAFRREQLEGEWDASPSSIPEMEDE